MLSIPTLRNDLAISSKIEDAHMNDPADLLYMAQGT